MVKKNLLLAVLGLMFIQEAFGQSPVVRIRFANPVYSSSTGKYAVDVEFQSNTAGVELFGMNLRFIYEESALGLSSIGDFEGGYRASGQPVVTPGSASTASLFGFTGPMVYVNSTVQLMLPGNPIYLSTTGWTRLFRMAFAIDDPKAFTSGEPFCPCLLWDLEQNPANGGFFIGSNGLVITAVNPSQSSSTIPVTENVVQFNWAYDGAPDPPFGAPVETNCIQIEGAGQCTISLKTGWNIISSWIMPADPDLKTIFQPLITEGKLVKVQDESGFSLEDLGFLGGWTNNIGPMLFSEGYKVKVTADCSLTITGIPAVLPFEIPLKPGWNITGFPTPAEADGLAVVRQLIDRGTLVKVQDGLGYSIEDAGLFGGWQNGIGNFKPGQGYKINVSTEEVLTIFSSYNN